MSFPRCKVLLGIICFSLAGLLYLEPAAAQQKSKVELDSSETIFTVLTAMNACGYDEGLSNSDPIRKEVREKVALATEKSGNAEAATKQICDFYRDHQALDASRGVLSQYVSLALNLEGPPDFKPKVKEADLPPDSSFVLGIVPLLGLIDLGATDSYHQAMNAVPFAHVAVFVQTMYLVQESFDTSLGPT